MIHKSKEETIPHSHVFFLDDNQYNIAFARYYGFQTFIVNNQSKKKDLFQRLNLVEKYLEKQNAKEKVNST